MGDKYTIVGVSEGRVTMPDSVRVHGQNYEQVLGYVREDLYETERKKVESLMEVIHHLTNAFREG